MIEQNFGKEASNDLGIEKEKGKDVKLHVILMRHGEKTPSGDLTDEGRQQAANVGKTLERPVKAYASFVTRAYQSAEEVVGTAEKALTHHGDTEKTPPRKKIELVYPLWSKEKLQEYRKIEAAGGNDALVDWALSFGDERPDEGTWSARERAEMMSYLLEHYINMTDRLNANSDIDLMNLTHATMPESLLKYTLVRNVDGQEVKGMNSVSEIGGSLGPSETMEILIDAKDKDKKSINLFFRGKSWKLDTDAIHELAQGFTKEKRKILEENYNPKPKNEKQ